MSPDKEPDMRVRARKDWERRARARGRVEETQELEDDKGNSASE